MNTDFPRIITLQRKERKISQKQAAADLGMSQALLSHYEKGIRECGLDFLVKAADYYNVSCDYLLGRAASPEEQFSPDENKRDFQKNTDMISDSVSIIMSLCHSKETQLLEEETFNYIMISLYRLFRIIYHSNEKNNSDMFKIPEITAENLSSSAIMKTCACIKSESNENFSKTVTTSGLAKEFPQASSLLKLIKLSEEKISDLR